MNENLINKIIKAANQINQTKGNGNYLIVSSKVAEIIKNIDIKNQRKKKLLEIIKKADK